MFESAEIGHRLSKRVYLARVTKLREALLTTQYELLASARFPVLVLVNGVDGAGKGETVNLLNEWMDPRHIHTHAFGPPNDEERSHPEMWRFWRILPPKGRIGILFGSWYTQPILDRVVGHEKRAGFERRLAEIRHFERMLVAEGVVLVKLWFHLSKQAQTKRLKKLTRHKSTAWQITREDRKNFKHYDEFLEVCELALRETSDGESPWNIIEGSDPQYRALTVGQMILDAMKARLGGKAAQLAATVPLPRAALDGRNILRALDYTGGITRAAYDQRLARAQARLSALSRAPKMQERTLIMVFEGMDAAGKGSTIRRVTRALDARFFRIVPVAAPTDEERAQPYLWRFWRHVPRRGQCVIFDRSWYGRVLVERVEGFCAEPDWMRAYQEINDFESQLTRAGAVVAKFWLAITPKEQLKRFHERESTPHKRYKITKEDWRNRRRWPQYECAVCDMVERTSTGAAPWNLIAADNKLRARVLVIERLCELLERGF